ncbi:RNA polymerase sigma factor [Pedobacter psychroterrae]|uniref:Sigma-70 family RNA polymerase sigma factor n=1 Tax=Pedobacter psychroterrae TaxID=2530453 RepID=A0A4R0ND52_9SPHI|nr:sigma-70 family RNA polymerase sigma factor [Pedobacter psychroterrae]TCC98281.1 sigma-70 family RNA polymerase sigma factor [Pedobacter psychroterrae]
MHLKDEKTIAEERDLLSKIAACDQRAFKIIYDRYARRVFLFSQSILNSEEHAEEVMQETMLKLWLLGPELENINNLDAYLLKLTRNRSLNVLSRIKLEFKTNAERAESFLDIDNGTEEEIMLNDIRKVLESGIAALPAQQKLVYQLYQEQGLKYGEIALKLDLAPSTVQTHMKLAVRFLRAYVSAHTDLAVLLIIYKVSPFWAQYFHF